VVGGVAHGVVNVLRRTLLDPQQAGDAAVLGAAGAAVCKSEAEQLGQEVLGLGAFEPPAAGLQLAALLLQKALAQAAGLIAEGEIELDGGRGGAVAPGPQVVHRGRAVALEEGRADGAHQRALAGLVGAGEEVEPGLQVGQLEGLAELAQLAHLQPRQPHVRPSSAATACRRSASSVVSSASASCATRACSGAASRSSAITVPR
jgi:hypothetical protein